MRCHPGCSGGEPPQPYCAAALGNSAQACRVLGSKEKYGCSVKKSLPDREAFLLVWLVVCRRAKKNNTESGALSCSSFMIDPKPCCANDNSRCTERKKITGKFYFIRCVFGAGPLPHTATGRICRTFSLGGHFFDDFLYFGFRLSVWADCPIFHSQQIGPGRK